VRKDIEDNFREIVATLKRGDLVVMKADTIYGIFCSAGDETAVAKLHAIRERDVRQGFITLADSVETIAKMVELRDEVFQRLKQIWNGKNPATSVILDASNIREKWLPDQRPEFKNTICFRVPNDEILRKLLRETGPLCAPSANLPDQLPAHNIVEAKNYFRGGVALFVDGGEVRDNSPSRIIKFAGNGAVETIRDDGRPHPEDFVISRKRKLYKFAKFLDDSRCFNLEKWAQNRAKIFANFAEPQNLSSSGLTGGSSKKNNQLDYPIGSDNDAVVAREIVAEIGAGSAIFLTKLAEKNPDKIFVAMDRKSDRLWQGAKLANELNLANIFFVWAEASRLSQVFAKNSVSEIWLNFPDPFAKDNYQTARADFAKFYHDNLRFSDDKDYAKNLAKYQKDLHDFSELSRKKFAEFLLANDRQRLTAPQFLESYKKLLRENGALNLKTDNAPLFEWSLKNFAKNWKTEFISRNLHNEKIAKTAPEFLQNAQIKTTYEEKFAAENWPIYFARFTKN